MFVLMMYSFVSMCLQLEDISYLALFIEARFGAENYSALLTGIIFASFAIGTILSTPFYSSVSVALGHKNTLVFAATVMLCSNTCCGCLGYIPTD